MSLFWELMVSHCTRAGALGHLNEFELLQTK